MDQYEALLEEVSHFSSEYNAGNAAYKLGKLGVARLHYERANLLDPGHAGLEANMALLESKIVDRIADVPNLGLKDWLRTWLGAEQLRGWLLGLGLLVPRVGLWMAAGANPPRLPFHSRVLGGRQHGPGLHRPCRGVRFPQTHPSPRSAWW